MHREKTRYNTGRQKSRAGKESGEEDNGSQKRKDSHPMLQWVSAGLRVFFFVFVFVFFYLAIVRSLCPRRDHLQLRWNLVGSELKVQQKEQRLGSKNRLLSFPSEFLVPSNRDQVWQNETEKEFIKRILRVIRTETEAQVTNFRAMLTTVRPQQEHIPSDLQSR